MVAPDLKAQGANLDGLQKQIEMLQKALQRQGEMLQKQGEMQYDSTMKAIDAFRAEVRTDFALLRANNQGEVPRQVGPIRERIALVEARQKK